MIHSRMSRASMSEIAALYDARQKRTRRRRNLVFASAVEALVITGVALYANYTPLRQDVLNAASTLILFAVGFAVLVRVQQHIK